MILHEVMLWWKRKMAMLLLTSRGLILQNKSEMPRKLCMWMMLAALWAVLQYRMFYLGKQWPWGKKVRREFWGAGSSPPVSSEQSCFNKEYRHAKSMRSNVLLCMHRLVVYELDASSSGVIFWKSFIKIVVPNWSGRTLILTGSLAYMIRNVAL